MIDVDNPGPTLRECVRLLHARLDWVTPIGQPLVMVCDPEGGIGGSLVRRLDGHPQCHVDATEDRLGFPRHEDAWPVLEPGVSPEVWLEMLRSAPGEKALVHAQQKGSGGRASKESLTDPKLMLLSLRDRLFHATLSGSTDPTGRTILDAWWTSSFNAWLDYQWLHGQDRRWIVTTVRSGLLQRHSDEFWADYPDGRLVAVVHEPGTARTWTTKGPGPWRRWTSHVARLRRSQPEKVTVVTAEAMKESPADATLAVAAWLGLEADHAADRETVNGRLITRAGPAPAAVPTEGVEEEDLRLYHEVIAQEQIAR